MFMIVDRYDNTVKIPTTDIQVEIFFLNHNCNKAII